jgi:hypothetical protein
MKASRLMWAYAVEATELGVAMKEKQQSLAAAILIANLALGANALFAQNLPGPNAPKPTLELLEEREPAIWQVAQAVPGPEPLPGQRGTIPERMPSPDSGSQQDGDLLRGHQEGTGSFEGERI